MFKSIISVFLLLLASGGYGQDTALWTADINALPDSVPVNPVKVLSNHNQDLYTLGNWYIGGDTIKTKIYLNKFSENGALIWTRIFQNTGKGYPRAFDMVTDGNDVCIAGIYSNGNAERPLLMKISSSGNTLWSRDSFTQFNSGRIMKLILKGNTLYCGGSGIACTGTDGSELWSDTTASNAMTVDAYGRMLVYGNNFGSDYLQRYDINGSRQFSKNVGISFTRRICSDAQNSIYILSDLPGYVLEKYDSSGNFEWRYNKFPMAPPFGDIGFEVLCDKSGNIYCIGISDTIFKFNTHGDMIQKLNMLGTDAHIISAALTHDDQLLTAGSYFNGTDYTIKAISYNLLGKINWMGNYNAPASSQEFAVHLCISEYNGIYVLENLNQNGRLIKFESPRQNMPNLKDVCVSRIRYDASDSGFVYVDIFNGSTAFVNYPSVRILSPSGDTISNRSNKVISFGINSNSYQNYRDSIYRKDITDFRTCKILFSIGFGDTTVELQWCDQSALAQPAAQESLFSLYPNPFSGKLNILSELSLDDVRFKLYDASGRCLFDSLIENGLNQLDIDLSRGMYFYLLRNGNTILQSGKLISE